MIRPAAKDDVPALVGLIRDLADYERSGDQVRIDESDLAEALFGAEPSAYARVAVEGAEVVAMMIYFRNFSTWTGRPGIHVEDIYVQPERRGQGIGRALLRSVAQLAVEEEFARVEWAVLDWNEPAITFYRSLGAEPLGDWTTYRLSGAALAEFARGSTEVAGD